MTNVRILIELDKLWEHCVANHDDLVDKMDMVAYTGDGEEDVRLFVTRNFDDEEDSFLLSLENWDAILDSDAIATKEGMLESAKSFIERMEEF